MAPLPVQSPGGHSDDVSVAVLLVVLGSHVWGGQESEIGTHSPKI